MADFIDVYVDAPVQTGFSDGNSQATFLDNAATFGKAALAAPINSAVGLADTVTSSLTFGLVDKGAIADTILNTKIGQSIGLYDQWKQHEDAYRLIGDVASLFVGGGFAMQAAKTASIGGKVSRGLLAADEGVNAWQTAKGYEAASKAIGSTADEVAKWRYMIQAADVQQGAAGMVNVKDAANRLTALSNTRNIGMIDTMQQFIATEIYMGATMNKSSTFFPEGSTLSDHLSMSAAFGVGFMGISAWKTFRAGNAGANMTGKARSAAETNQAAYSADLSTSIAGTLELQRTLQGIIPEAGQDLANNLGQRVIAGNRKIIDELSLLATENLGATSSVKIDQKLMDVFLKTAEPALIQNVYAIESTQNLANGNWKTAAGKKIIANDAELASIKEGRKRFEKRMEDANYTATPDEIKWLSNTANTEAKLITDNFNLRVPEHVLFDGVGNAIPSTERALLAHDYGTKLSKDGESFLVNLANGKRVKDVRVSPELHSVMDLQLANLLTLSMHNRGIKALIATDKGVSAIKAQIDLGKVNVTNLAKEGNFGAIDGLVSIIGKEGRMDAEMLLNGIKAPKELVDAKSLEHWANMQKIDYAVKDMQRVQNAAKGGEISLNDYGMKYGLALTDKGGMATALGETVLKYSKAYKGSRISSSLYELFDTPEKLNTFVQRSWEQGRKIGDVKDVLPVNKISQNLAEFPWEVEPIAIFKNMQKQEQFSNLGLEGIAKEKFASDIARLDEGLVNISGYKEWAANPLSQITSENLVHSLSNTMGTGVAPLVDIVKKGLNSLTGGQLQQNVYSSAFATQGYRVLNMFGGTEAGLLWSAVQRGVQAEWKNASKFATETIAAFSRPENAHHLLNLNQWLSARKANFVLKEGFTAEGMTAIDLSTKELIAAAKQKMDALSNGKLTFDPEVMRHMPDPLAAIKGEYIPIRLTKQAQALAEEMGAQSELIRTYKNQIAYAADAPQIGKINHYMQNISHLDDAMHIVVDIHDGVKRIVMEQTEAASLRAANEYVAAARKNGGETLMVVPKSSIEKFNAAKDMALREGNSILDKGRGGDYAQHFKIGNDNSQLVAMMGGLRMERNNIARDVMRVHMQQELKAAKNISEAMGLRGVNNAKGEQVYDTPLSMMEQVLFGAPIEKAGSLMSKLETGTTTITKPIMEATLAAREKYADIKREILTRAKFISPTDLVEVGKKLNAELGYNPFGSINEATAFTNYGKNATFRDAATAGNSLMSYVTLLTDPLHGAMTAMTPATMGGGLIQLMNPARRESSMAFNARRGEGIDGFYRSADGTPIITDLSFGKAVAQHMRTDDFRKFSKAHMVDNPLLQQIERIDDTFSAIKAANRGDFMKIVDNVGGINTGMLTAASRAGEHASNIQTSAMAHYLIKQTGQTFSSEMEQVLVQNLRNRISGNYNPSNKPEFFKTTLGTPFGLFQNFMTHTFENLLHGIEIGHTSALKTAAAYQGSLFGVQGVPGWDLVTSHMFKSWDGDRNLNDTAEKAFGVDAWHAIGHGSLWSIPKLFGGNSIGLYTRGDLNIQPGGGIPNFDWKEIPSIQAVTKVLGASVDFVKYAASMGENRAALESLIRNTLNRPLRGMMEVAVGYTTDNAGNLINANTREWSTALYRVLGAKTGEELSVAELVYGEKEVEQRHRRAIGVANKELRAMVHAGDVKAFDSYTLKYTAAGGTPENLSRAFNVVVREANENYHLRFLDKVFRNAPDFNAVRNIGDRLNGQ